MKRLLLVFFSCGLHLHAAPHWIQPVDGAKGFHLTQSFQVSEGIKSAHLRVVADFVDLELAINGRKVAVCEMFGPVVEMDVRSWLQAGKNEISLRSVSQLTNPAPGDAGSGKEKMAKVRPLTEDAVVALEMEILDHANKATIIATSPDWQGAQSLRRQLEHVRMGFPTSCAERPHCQQSGSSSSSFAAAICGPSSSVSSAG